MFEYEEKAKALGYENICGVDEAGAGPLAGPVVAAAVILPSGETTLQQMGLTDSKKLSEKKREQLFLEIQKEALAFHIAFISPQEIDESDILSARLKAMSLAVESLSPAADYALIDGDKDKGRTWEITFPHELIVKGDALSLSVAAASVLAKVSRDHYMVEQDAIYPEYAFAKHKGYGTALHYEKIRSHKLCPLHRRSFLKKKWHDLGLP